MGNNLGSSKMIEFENGKTVHEQLGIWSEKVTALETGKADKTEVTPKADKTYVDTELAKKRDSSVKLGQTDMTEEFLQQMAGTTPVNSIPQDSSVTPKKTTFFTTGKNLFDVSTMIELTGQIRQYSTGNIVSGSSYVGLKIPVQGNKSYVMSSNTFFNNIAFFDSGMVYISGLASPTTFTTPANAAYVTIALNNTYTWFQLEEGTFSTAYEPYGYLVKGENIPISYIESQVNTSLKKDLMTQEYFGKNAAFYSTTPWSQVASGTSTQEWLSNVGEFLEGDYYGKFTVGDTSLVGIMTDHEIPDKFKGDTTKTVRVSITYKSNKDASIRIYQRTQAKAWVNNTVYYTVNLPATDKEKTVDITFKIQASTSYYITPFLYGSMSVAGTVLKISSMKYSIMGGSDVGNQSKRKTVTVKASGGDFTSIQAAINGVYASEDSPVDILIDEGIWTEELIGKHYVNLIGVDRDKTIIQSLPDSTNVVNRDILKANFNMTIKNLTMNATHTKYCIHNDATVEAPNHDPHVLIVENCVLNKTLSGGYDIAIGMGLRANQHMIIRNCIITGAGGAVYMHNWNNQSAPCILEIENSKLIGTSRNGLWLDCLGSNHTDLVILKGNKIKGGQYDLVTKNRLSSENPNYHGSDEIKIIASGNEVATYTRMNGSQVPFEQPILVTTTVTDA